MRTRFAVIVAGGRGTRMGGSLPKQFLLLRGKPVLHYSIEAFTIAYPDIRIVLVHPAGEAARIQAVISAFPGKRICAVAGGDSRFASVRNGLARVGPSSVVFVHDGARPLVTPRLIRVCHEAALEKGCAVPCLPLHESIRRMEDGRNVRADRNAFRSVQTPQTFLSELLLPAFDRPFDPAFTDEATVVEAAGHEIHLVEGEAENIKITRPPDLWFAEACLLHREQAPPS